MNLVVPSPCETEPINNLFAASFSHLHYNVIQRMCEVISGLNYKAARNCLTNVLDYIVMQMRKVKRKMGYYRCER